MQMSKVSKHLGRTSKFHVSKVKKQITYEEPQILGATIQYLVAQVTWHLGASNKFIISDIFIEMEFHREQYASLVKM